MGLGVLTIIVLLVGSAQAKTVPLDFAAIYNRDVVYGTEDDSVPPNGGDFDGFAAFVTNSVANRKGDGNIGLPDDG